MFFYSLYKRKDDKKHQEKEKYIYIRLNLIDQEKYVSQTESYRPGKHVKFCFPGKDENLAVT